MPAGGIGISGQVPYYNRPPWPGETPRATLLVQRQLSPTEFEEFVAVTVKVGKRFLTIASAYEIPGAPWDTKVLEGIRA